jgi:hypothetical protein
MFTNIVEKFIFHLIGRCPILIDIALSGRLDIKREKIDLF